MSERNLLKVFALVVVTLFCILTLLNAYYVYVHYPKKCKLNGCMPPIHRNSFPAGLIIALKTAYWYSKHDVNEFLRRELLKGDHTISMLIAGNFEIVTDDPENIKAMISTKFTDFDLGDRYDSFYPFIGEGIFTLDGERWKHSRSMLRPQFERNQIINFDFIKESTNKLISRIDEAMAKDETVDVQALFFKLTIDTTTEFLFGTSTDTLDPTPKKFPVGSGFMTGAEFVKVFGYCQVMVAYRVIVSSSYWLIDSFKFRRQAKICKSFLDAFVNKALETPMEKGDVGDRYVFINELTKQTRDPVVIRDQAINVLMAGRDTTAGVLSFVAANLSANRDVWQKLRAEVLEVIGTDESAITFESLKRCTYLHWVLNETMRLHPVLPFNFRKAAKDTTLPRGGGPNGDQPILVDAGITVAYSSYSMHRRKDFWGEDADVFRPERWSEIKNAGWKYLPFNGGPRICIGQQYAMAEMGVIWARLAQTYSEFDSNWTVEKLYRTRMHQRVTVSVENGVESKWKR